MQLFYPDSASMFKWLQVKFWMLQLLILADIMLISYTDPFNNMNSSITVQALVVRWGEAAFRVAKRQDSVFVCLYIYSGRSAESTQLCSRLCSRPCDLQVTIVRYFRKCRDY